MKKHSIALFLLASPLLLLAMGHPRPPKPVVFAINAQALEKNRGRINAKDSLIMPAYKQLLKEAEQGLQYGPVSVMEKKNDPPSGDKHDYMSLAPYFWPDPSKPNGLPYMRKDGQTNPEVKDYKDKEYMPKLCDVVHTLALAYYFSGEKMYADHAAKLLRVWFLDKETRMNPNLNYAQAIKGQNEGRGAGLIDSRHFILVVDAIGLLQGSSAWKNEDQQGMKQWFAAFLQWMQTSKNGRDELKAPNNHGAWYDAQRLSLALFIDSTDLAKKIVQNAATRLDNQMDDKGMFPHELERTISLHYSSFVMNAFFTIAQEAESVDRDLWNYVTPSGKSLRKGFDTILPYITKQKDWDGQQIKDFDYEDSFPLLLMGAAQYDCRHCKQDMKNIAGDKADRLLINLLY